MSDYDELVKHKTSPLKIDNDGDGISDYDELVLKTNPNAVNKTVNLSKKSSDNKLTVTVKNVEGNKSQSLSITEGGNTMVTKKNKGYVAGPYDIQIDGNITSATLTFNINTSAKNPTIYYINSEKDILEEVPTTRNGNTISGTVNHFSQYIVMDKEYLSKVNKNAAKTDESNIDKNIFSEKEYLIIAFPLLTVLKNEPVYIYEIDGNLKDLEVDQQEVEKIIQADEEFSFRVVFRRISRFIANILDKILGWLENVVAESYKSATDSDDYHTILQFIVMYKHVYGTKDLERFLFEEEKNVIKDDEIPEEIDKEKDSNNDGITDYYTKLICAGKITTKYGENPFGNVSFSAIQKNNDYDKDKIKNGEEIEIIEENGQLFATVKSSPVEKDTDGDGVIDSRDASPKEKFDTRFKAVDSYNYVPPTPTEDSLEEKSDKIYNTASGDYSGILDRANFQVSLFGNMPAALALGHFLDNTGTTYGFNNDKSILDTYRGEEGLAKNTNSMMNVVESTVKKGDTLYFATDKELTGTAFGTQLEDLSNIGWWYAVGHTRATMTVEAKNNDDINYEMKIRYNLVDYYDWENNSLIEGGFGGLVTDAEMYKLHTYGVAKQYRINMSFDIKVTWKKGDRWYLNAIWLYTTPNTMKVEY